MNVGSKVFPEHVKKVLERPAIIYKYFPINDFLLSSLKDNYLWFSKPKDFNDPFDNNVALLKFSPKKSDIWAQFSKNKLNSKITGNRRDRKLMAAKYINNPEEYRDTFLSVLDEALNKRGVCCFSKINSNILMWSHYADKHQGICLGFDPSTDPDFFVLLKVTYRESFESYDYFNKDFGKEKALLNVQLTKSVDWEYEQEMRILHNQFGRLQFLRKSLRHVIFGCRTSLDCSNRIKEVIKNGGYEVNYFRSHILKNKFALEIRPQ